MKTPIFVRSFSEGEREALQAGLRSKDTFTTAKIAAYTYAFLVNRMLGRSQGRIKQLWA